MQNPRSNLISLHARLREHFREDSRRVLGRKRRHLSRQNVSQHPFALLEAKVVAVFRAQNRPGCFPFDATLVWCRRVAQNGSAGAVAEQTGADQYAGIVIQIKGRAAHFDTNGQNSFAPSAGQQGFGRPPIRQGGATALPDQVERQHIRAQAEPFADVTRQTRTEVAGAGADNHRVDPFRPERGVPQRFGSRLRGQRRRIFGKTGV